MHINNTAVSLLHSQLSVRQTEAVLVVLNLYVTQIVSLGYLWS